MDYGLNHANISRQGLVAVGFGQNSPNLDVCGPFMSKICLMQWLLIKNSNFVAEFFPAIETFQLSFVLIGVKNHHPSCAN